MGTVSDAINQISSWFYRQLDLLKHYPSQNHRLIILLAIIESFAQNNSDFTRHSQEAFVTFIQTYSVRYSNILTAICPVTLYYSKCDAYRDMCLNLQRGTIYLADSSEAISEANTLLAQLPNNQKERAVLKHSYAGLIYQLRNKLSHEFMSLNMPLNFQYDADEQLPHMACENRVENNSLVFHRWALYIPEEFVKNVAVDSIEHYLEDCASRNYIPFNKLDRKCYNSWYD